MSFIANPSAGSDPDAIIENALADNEPQPVLPLQLPRPVEAADRIQTVDLIRGFALLGILLMNIPGFGIDTSAFFEILGRPIHTKDGYAMMTMFTFFDGTMRGLFSMLFGAGMILFTLNKKEAAGGASVAEYYYRRLLWLVLFGMFNAYILLWDGDILFFYGLCGMVLYVFRKSAIRLLFLLGIICIGITMLKNMLWYNQTRTTRADYLSAIAAEKANTKLTEKQEEAKTKWADMEKRQLPDTVAANKNVAKMRSGYSTIFAYFIPRNSSGETWYTYHGIWDMLAMMFIGMALFKLGFFTNKLSTATYAMALIAGYGIGMPLGYLYFKGLVASLKIASYVDSYSVPHWLLYDFRRFFLCVGHASLLLLIYRSRLVPWLMKALASVGQMAFTNYLMQSIICTWFFFGYGFGNYNHLKFYQLYYVVGAVWVFQLIASPIWLQYFRFGPFEWVWRSLTYWKRQPMRRTQKNLSVQPAL